MRWVDEGKAGAGENSKAGYSSHLDSKSSSVPSVFDNN